LFDIILCISCNILVLNPHHYLIGKLPEPLLWYKPILECDLTYDLACVLLATIAILLSIVPEYDKFTLVDLPFLTLTFK